jgi:sortase A
MHFKHKKNGEKKRGWKSNLLLAVSMILLASGLYLLLLVLTPNIAPLFPVDQIDAKTLDEPDEDRIVIPKAGIDIEYRSGGSEVLDSYAWHRFPERGDPENGGNFIISAHRFEIGFTPNETRRKSPFYHVEKLEVGDQIIVDYNKKRYGYEITEKTSVKPDQVEIESTSEEAKLTLYTCTLSGSSDGRVVFIAKPLGEVKDGNVAGTN